MDIESIIIELEERLRVAQLKSDIDELSVLVDDKIIFLALDGSVIGKQDDINLHESPDFQITKMNVIERTIQPFEQAAVVNSLMDASADIAGNVQNDRIRYIRVWYRFSDGWRIISGSMRVETA